MRVVAGEIKVSLVARVNSPRGRLLKVRVAHRVRAWRRRLHPRMVGEATKVVMRLRPPIGGVSTLRRVAGSAPSTDRQLSLGDPEVVVEGELASPTTYSTRSSSLLSKRAEVAREAPVGVVESLDRAVRVVDGVLTSS